MWDQVIHGEQVAACWITSKVQEGIWSAMWSVSPMSPGQEAHEGSGSPIFYVLSIWHSKDTAHAALYYYSLLLSPIEDLQKIKEH